MTMPQTDSDPVIDEVREARREISEEVQHDPVRLIEYYTEFQRRYQDRLLRPSGGSAGGGKSAA